MTRYEKIKNMSIEEMAKKIRGCMRCVYNDDRGFVCHKNCVEGTKQWLKQEADDED